MVSWEEWICPNCSTRRPVVYPWEDEADPRETDPQLVRTLVVWLVLIAAGLAALFLVAWPSSLF